MEIEQPYLTEQPDPLPAGVEQEAVGVPLPEPAFDLVPVNPEAYTRGRWSAHEEADDILVDTSGTTLAIVASTFRGDKQKGREEKSANARRIVAAVNAVAGLPTTEVERLDLAKIVDLIHMVRMWVPPESGLWTQIATVLTGSQESSDTV